MYIFFLDLRSPARSGLDYRLLGGSSYNITSRVLWWGFEYGFKWQVELQCLWNTFIYTTFIGFPRSVADETFKPEILFIPVLKILDNLYRYCSNYSLVVVIILLWSQIPRGRDIGVSNWVWWINKLCSLQYFWDIVVDSRNTVSRFDMFFAEDFARWDVLWIPNKFCVSHEANVQMFFLDFCKYT